MEQIVPKLRHIKLRRRGITQKTAHNIQNTVKFEIKKTNECLNVICAVSRHGLHDDLTDLKFKEIDSQQKRIGNFISCILAIRIHADILKGSPRSLYYIIGNYILFK